MVSALINFSLTQRLMILLTAGMLIIIGLWSYKTLPIDAFPDISSPQVQIIINAPGMSPNEVEQRITFPIELEMQGLPNQQVLRSLTKYALSIITIDFADGTDIYWARQVVTERLNQVWSTLPAGVKGGLAPITTPLGEIYMYRIVGAEHSNQELRTIQDWIIRPRLRAVEGVADVNSLGGKIHSFEVVPDPKALAQHGLSLDDIEESLVNNNRNAGGDRISREKNMLLVRTVGNLHNINDIKNVAITIRNAVPIYIYDVAEVRIGSLTRYGGVTSSGEGEIVTGLILLRKGANSRAVVEASKKEIESLKTILPKGVSILPFYDRSELIETAVFNIETALVGAVILVLLVLLVMLGNLRAALTVAMILPLSVLSTFILMRIFGVSANLMSLGGLAIAIGILVDASVVVVENIYLRLQKNVTGVSHINLIYRAVLEVAAPVISGVLIIVIVFLPLFSLTGIEGKLFTPLATAISFALISSLILSLTVIPVMATFLMSKKQADSTRHDDDEGKVLKILKNIYVPIMLWALRKRNTAIMISLTLLLFAVMLLPFTGREFMPVMDEGTTVVIIEKTPSISLEESLKIDAVYQNAIMEMPEVTGVISRTGADELRLDPMGLYQTDNFIITKPRSEWKISLTEFQDNVRKKLEQFSDIDIAFTQPIDMRVSEMLTGVRSTLAIKLYGDDLKILEQKSEKIAKLISNIEGAVDIISEPVFGQLYLQININQKKIARYGIRIEDINKIVETAVGGRIVTEIIENNRPVPVILRYPKEQRNSFKNIAALLIETPNGAKISLGKLATIHEVDGPVQITRESVKRQVIIQANVKDRDVVGFINEVRRDIKQKISLPSGYYITFGGQFENQQRASTRLMIIFPISIILIFIILFMTFRSLRQATLIILNVPFAMIGGVVALYMSGLYLSVPASVGFIILFGVSILNGVVMVSYFNQLRAVGRSIIQAVEEGAVRRLRPVLMTSISTGLGLAPLLILTGPGSELQQPLATVVIGGLFTSMLLTLVLLPTLYVWMENLGIKKSLNN
jgi:cobalt-zinc-cadmium resistance protein CzcA